MNDQQEGAKRWRSKVPVWLMVVVGSVIVLIWVGSSFLLVEKPSDELQIYPQRVLVEDVQTGALGEQSTETEKKKPGLAYANTRPKSVTVEGIVLHNWQPISESNVRVIMTGKVGNSYAVGTSRTNEVGEFQIKGTVQALEPLSPEEIEIAIHAKGGMQGEKIWEGLDGRTTLGARASHQTQSILVLPAIAALILFLLSLLVAFVNASAEWEKRVKHVASVTLAIFFTITLIGAIAAGLNYVHAVEQDVDTLSLGYGYVFKGSYVGDKRPEWNFSLTAPQWKEKLASDPPDSPGRSYGFGAPLWVILLSVIGAAIATVKLIITEARETLEYTNDKEAVGVFRERIQAIVTHQFFILFAPLGAIFVYQMLVSGDAASKPITVAVAALGSGPALNYVLARAIGTAKTLVGGATNVGAQE